MLDLEEFARETARLVVPPQYESLVRRHRGRQRRRAAIVVGSIGAAAVLAVLIAFTPLGRATTAPAPARPDPTLTSVNAPDWTPEQIVGAPDALAVEQHESATDASTVLTVWKRCLQPSSDPECTGVEAIVVKDGLGDRLLTRGSVTSTSGQATLSGRGTFIEVSPGVWYWAHQDPGPYLLRSIIHVPARLTVEDRPVPARIGMDSVPCADQVGRCLLDTNARTLERIDLPTLPNLRWATPTTCGFWGTATPAGRLQLVIQQADGSFATSDAPAAESVTMAEGGGNCEIALYLMTADERWHIMVSLDHGHSWQARTAPGPHPQLVEAYPRLRVLLPRDWSTWPSAPTPSLPGPLRPL